MWHRTRQCRVRAVGAALLVGLAAGPARADCETGVGRLMARIAGVTDPHVRNLLDADLKQAQLDLWEFDEVECAVALEHATRVLMLAAKPDANSVN